MYPWQLAILVSSILYFPYIATTCFLFFLIQHIRFIFKRRTNLRQTCIKSCLAYRHTVYRLHSHFNGR